MHLAWICVKSDIVQKGVLGSLCDWPQTVTLPRLVVPAGFLPQARRRSKRDLHESCEFPVMNRDLNG